ncbi:MAG: patatin-like phospholipase family protein [Bacteroidales bacterium]
MTKKIGITLCGGGMRGICQIGVLHALEKNGISPEYVSGASIGAIIGVFYAAGVSPLEILEISRQSTMIKIFNPTISLQGISNLKYLKTLLEKNLPFTTFEKLNKKLYVAATNLHKGRLEIFSSGDCILPVMASAAVPVVFEPQEINGEKYVDASILNNLPIEPIRPLTDILIGTYVHSHGPMEGDDLFNNWRSVIDRSVSLSLYGKSVRQLRQCDFVIEPEKVFSFSAFNKKNDQILFDLGVEEAEKIIPQIKKAIQS